MALWIRGRDGEPVEGLIHHSDAGSQYTAIRYAERLLDAGALAGGIVPKLRAAVGATRQGVDATIGATAVLA
jgi:transposase InsO family protein